MNRAHEICHKTLLLVVRNIRNNQYLTKCTVLLSSLFILTCLAGDPARGVNAVSPVQEYSSSQGKERKKLMRQDHVEYIQTTSL